MLDVCFLTGAVKIKNVIKENVKNTAYYCLLLLIIIIAYYCLLLLDTTEAESYDFLT